MYQQGQLVAWNAPSGTVGSAHYLYDNSGTRVLTNSTKASTTTDTIYFDGYTETVLSGGTTTTTKYYGANGQNVAVRVGSSTLNYLLNDLLGSPSVALSSTGQVIAAQHYSPYGTMDYSWGTMPTSYNYTGQRLDSQTGLLYYNARYYDPTVGRFIAADTVQGNEQAADPYGYVHDNPETRTDPTGHADVPHNYFFDLVVEEWYASIETGNTVHGDMLNATKGMSSYTLDNANVQKPPNQSLAQWTQELSDAAEAGTSVQGGGGRPDLINATKHLIYEVKTGATQTDGTSNFAASSTVAYGVAQVAYYASRANSQNFLGSNAWQAGSYISNPLGNELETDPQLAGALGPSMMATEFVPWAGKLYRIDIKSGAPGVLTYRAQLATQKQQSQFNAQLARSGFLASAMIAAATFAVNAAVDLWNDVEPAVQPVVQPITYSGFQRAANAED